MGLLTELDAFYRDHRRCGELDAGVDGPDRLAGLRVRRRNRPPWMKALT